MRNRTSLETERAEMARRCDLARGFAGMASDPAARRAFQAKAREWGRAAMALDDALTGGPSAEVAAMDDAALIAALSE